MNEKILLKELITLHNKQKDSYNFDLYEFNYKIPNGVKTNDNYIKETINLFKSFHDDFDENKLINNINIFEEIIKNDKLISIHNKIILKEFYTIIFFIYETQINLNTLNKESYPNNYFAKLNTDKREIKKLSDKQRREYNNVKIPLSKLSRKEHKLFSRLLKVYYKDKIFFELIISSFVINDIEKIKLFDNIDEERINIIFNLLNYFTMQKTTKRAIIKSFAILLFNKLNKYLDMNIIDSERNTDLIIEYLFDVKINTSNIDNIIYISSLLNSIPIFGAKRKSHYTSNHLKTIKTIIFQNQTTSLEKYIKKGLHSFHLQYINKYPIELLKIKTPNS